MEVVGRVPLLSIFLRRQARRYREGSVVRIKLGLAAGCLWKRYHRYVNGYWIGHYELPIQRAMARELKRGATVFDVGANAGFFTLVAARLVGAAGKCLAFDPSPENCQSIREQIELNELKQCDVFQEAVAGYEGKAWFSFEAPGCPLGHLGPSREGEQQMEVQVTTLDRASDRLGQPHFVKLDVEGAEGRTLDGATRLLSVARPIWLIELHDAQNEAAVSTTLLEAGYELFSVGGTLLKTDRRLPRHVIARPRQ